MTALYPTDVALAFSAFPPARLSMQIGVRFTCDSLLSGPFFAASPVPIRVSGGCRCAATPGSQTRELVMFKLRLHPRAWSGILAVAIGSLAVLMAGCSEE